MTFRVFCAWLGLLLATAGLSAQDRPILLMAGKVHRGDGTIFAPGEVLIHKGKILAVGKSLKTPKGTRKRAFPRGEITAGMIDAAASGLEITRSNPEAREVVPASRVLDCLDLTDRRFELLAREGVTTVGASGPESSVVGPRVAVVKTGTSSAARVLVAAGAPKINLTHGPLAGNSAPRSSGYSLFTRYPTSLMGVNFIARQALGRARDLEARAPRDLAKDEDMKLLVDALHGRLTLRVRANEQHEMATGLRISKEFGVPVIIEGGAESWRLVAELKAAKTSVILGPLKTRARPRVSRGFGRPGRGVRRRPTAAAVLQKAGVPFALTAGSDRGAYGLAEQVRIAMRHGLGFVAALQAVTVVPARLLGVGDRVGAVEVGKDADLIVWGGVPFGATSPMLKIFVSGESYEARID